IGRYVKQNNILVPDIYDSRRDARRSGKELIERSESALEYAGASDICQSLGITNKSGKLSWRFPPDLGGCPGDTVLPLPSNKDNMLKALRLVSANSIRVQCNMLELDFEEQMAATSFSLWEDLPGLNLKIAGDSCIKGRYHMTV
ncbi:MAG: hypothetical protein NT051_01665, partial [Candidatus Micrarchaeota archaeon]|nr:hypothetical protein [Candidatus Micrarchaeota archaeon]